MAQFAIDELFTTGVQISGFIFDRSYSLGIAGQVLTATSSGVMWQADSSSADLSSLSGQIAATGTLLNNRINSLSGYANDTFLSGNGVTNYVPRWNGSKLLITGSIYDLGTGVGIGTTSPSAKLEVFSGNAIIRNDNPGGVASLYIRNWATNPTTQLVFGNSTSDDSSTTLDLSANVFSITNYGDPGSYIKFGTRNLSTAEIRVTIDPSGRVGIGTEIPSTLLSIGGAGSTTALSGITFGADSQANLYRISSSRIKTDGNFTIDGQGGGASSLVLNRISDSYENGMTFNTAGAVDWYFFVNDASNHLQIQRSSELDPRPRVRFDGSNSNILFNLGGGNVGIGTATPAGRLHVSGADGNVLYLKQGVTGSQGGIYFENVDGFATSSARLYFISGDSVLFTRGPSNLAWSVSQDAKVGIGVSNPSEKLTITGAVKILTRDGANFKVGDGSNNNTFLEFDYPDISTANAHFRLFRSTNTNGGKYFQIFKGDGTAGSQTLLNASGDSYINAVAGNVGVGTDNPSYKLDVIGTVRANGELISDGNNARISLFRNNGINYFDWASGQSLYFSTQTSVGGAGRNTLMTVTSGGRVGIGLVSPTDYLDFGAAGRNIVFTYAAYGEILNSAASIIGNNVKASPTSNSQVRRFANANDAGNFIKLIYNKGVTFHTNLTSALNLDISEDTNERMRINLSGDVGIGAINPIYRLQLQADNPTNGVLAQFYNYNAGAAGANGAFTIWTQYGIADWFIGQPSGVNALTFGRDKTSSATGVEYMRINSAGNVGIGSTNPTVRLVVANTETTTSTSTVRIIGSTGNGAGPQIEFFKGANQRFSIGAASAITGGLSEDLLLATLNPSSIILAAGVSGLAVFKTDGKVGIGMYNPISLLSIGGIASTSAASGITFGLDDQANLYRSAEDTLKTDGSLEVTTNLNIGADLYVADELGVGVPIANKRVNYGAQINTASASIQLVLGRTASATGQGAIGADANNTFAVWNVSGGFSKQMVVSQQGNVGIAVDVPTEKLHVAGTFLLGSIRKYLNYSISVALNSTGWIKLATIPNNSRAKFLMRNGSNNSEEVLEFDVIGTYYLSQTYIEVKRQTYNNHVTNIYITSSATIGQPKTVYVLCRTSSFAPTFEWQIESLYGAAATVHNIEETPTSTAGLFINYAIGTNSIHFDAYPIASFNGSVGIGTNNPVTKLHISDPNNNDHWMLLDINDTYFKRIVFSEERATYGNTGYGGYIGYDADVNTISLGTYSNSIHYRSLNIKREDGTVGIGTTNPNSTLELYKIPATSGTLQRMLTITSDYPTAATTNFGSSIVFKGKTAGNALQDNAQIAAYNEDMGDNGYALGFYTRPTVAAGLQQRLTILRGGNVGIGTVSPVDLLTVQGNINVNFNSASANYVRRTFATNHNAANRGASLLFGMFDGGEAGIRITNTGSSSPSYNSQFITFLTHEGNVSADERMRITSTGDVGIGITNPYGRLDVQVASASRRYLTISTTDGQGSFNGFGLNFRIADQAHDIAQIRGAYESSSLGGYGGLVFATRFSGTLYDRFSINDNGRVGVGVSYGTTLLSVGGAGSTTAASGLTFGADAQANLYRSAEDVIKTDGSLIITNSLGLGISPVQKLHIDGVVGNPALNGTVQSGIVRISNQTDNAVLDFGIRAAGSGAWLQSTDETSLGTYYALLLNPNGGNVGIGTTIPSYKLEVRNNSAETVAQFRGLNDTTIIIGGNDAGRIGEQYITYQNADTAGNAWMVGMDDAEDFRFAYGTAGEIADSNTKVKIGQNGNVGIGQTNPLEKLQVQGNIYATDAALFNFKAQRIPLEGNPQGGTYKGYLILAKAYTSGLVNASYVIGKIILRRGTSGTGHNTDVYEVHSGTGYNTEVFQVSKLGTTSSRFLRLVKVTYGGVIYHAIETSSGGGSPSTEMFFEGSIVDSPLILTDESFVSNVTAFGNIIIFVDDSSNVGIGTATPAYKLNVYSSDQTIAGFAGSNVSQIIRFGNTAATQFTDLILSVDNGQAEIFRNGGGYTSYGGVSSLNIYNNNGPIAFHPNNTANAMFLSNAANLGIGTTNPTQKLEVAGYSMAGVGTYRTSIYGSNGGAWISFGDTSVLDSLGRIGAYSSLFNINSINGDISFQYNSSEKMRITTAGNVGIGLTNPADKIQISGGGVSFTTSTGLAVPMLGMTSLNVAYVGPYATTTDGNAPSLVLFNHGTSVQQTYFYSSGRVAMVLNREGRLHIGNLNNAPNCLLSVGPSSSTTAVSGMCFGNDAEANFYRSAEDTIKSDGNLIVVGNVTAANLISGNGTTNYITKWNGTKSVTNSQIFDDGAYVGINTVSNTTYRLQVNGSFAATTKSFDIVHPTVSGKRLIYASLEGPENGVYYRGQNNNNEINLPHYWSGLVHEDSLTVNLTAVGKRKDGKIRNYSVDQIGHNKVYIYTDSDDNIYNYYYTIFAERKDVSKLVTERYTE